MKVRTILAAPQLASSLASQLDTKHSAFHILLLQEHCSLCLDLETQLETKPATTTKKRKDPDHNDGFPAGGPTKLRKPLSSFFLFSQEQRPKVRAKYPHLTTCEIAQVLGEKWKACPNQAKYKARAAKEKEIYEVATYLQGV